MTATSIRRLRGGLIAAAEGGWIAVVYAAADAGILHRGAALGLLPFVVAAGLGIAITRSGDRGPARSRLGEILFVLVAALAGLILEHSGTLADSVLLPGPWFVALAAWRGLQRGDPNGDGEAISTLIARGGLGLAVPWLVGTAGGPGASSFLAPALIGTLVFVAAGLTAVGLARLERLALDTGADAAQSALWLRLLGVVVGGIAIIGVPGAWLVGVPLRAAAGAVIGPVDDVFAALIQAAGGLLPSAGTPLGPVNPGVGGGGGSPLDIGTLAPVILGVPLLMAIVALVVLARDRTRGARVGRPFPPDQEERRFERPKLNLHLPHIGRPAFGRRHHARPTSATGAYLSVLRQLASDPALAHAPAETVRVHARRVGLTLGYRLNLLAADYEREQYGPGSVSRAETHRALRRARELLANRRPAAGKPPGMNGR